MQFGQERLAETTRAVWRRGGLETLVTALPFLAKPDPDAPVPPCTALRFLLGLQAAEMGPVLGGEADLAGGAEIFAVAPLPEAGEFELLGYGPRRKPPADPEPVPVDPADPDAPPPRRLTPLVALHPIYPPAFGPPRWRLLGPTQARLRRLASVPKGQVFTIEPRPLPPIRD